MRDYIGTVRFLLGGSPARTAFFLAFWLMLYGVNSANLLIGLLATIIATWARRRLLLGRSSLRPISVWRDWLFVFCVSRSSPELMSHDGTSR